MKYPILFAALLLISCSSEVKDQNKPEAQSSETIKTSSSAKKSCLNEVKNPADWLDVETLATIVNEAAANIEVDAMEKYSSLQFGWKNDRKTTAKLGDREMEYPASNVVAITVKNVDEAIIKAQKYLKNKEFTYAEYFKSYHGHITEEAEKAIDDAIDKEGEENENFDATTAKKILDMAPTEGYENIEGLGDLANKYTQLAPGLRETRLSILTGNAVLMINVDISADDTVDIAIAKDVAKAVLALCD